MNENLNSRLIVTIISVAFFLLLIFLFVVVIAVRYRKRKKENEELRLQYEKELCAAQLEIQEQTFNTISQEIHDNVGQTLSLAKVQVNIIDQSQTTDKQLLAEVKDNIGKAMNDLRDLAKSLNSDHIQLRNLRDLIEPELCRMERSRIVATAVKENGIPQPIAQQKKLILFRIVQEALQNIIKHADASLIIVLINYSNENVQITIADDGKGFHVNSADKAKGLGLQNITNRAKLIGGNAAITSSPGEGTSINLTIPYA